MNVAHQTVRQATTPPEELPQFLNRPPRKLPRMNIPKSVSEFEEDDDLHTPFSVLMTEYLWPTMFWFMVAFNVAILALAVANIAESGYNVWIHSQAALVTIGTIGMAAMIVKWILHGPDGLPGMKHRHTRPPALPAGKQPCELDS